MWYMWKVVFLALLELVLCQSASNLPPNNTMSPRSRRPSNSQVILTTKSGNIKGTAQRVNLVDYTHFLGVPYGEAPHAHQRFMEAMPHPGWGLGTTYDATYYRPFCVQNSENIKRHLSATSKPSWNEVRTDEDCLYINLYIPRNLSDVRHVNTLSLPVLIYIPGWGPDDMRVGDLWKLAGSGDVIIAQINYRVGPFGFLSLLDSLARGNYGLRDQHLAIHWIWDNIREFGGDPEKMTLYGISTGAISVGLHMISPQSKGMFGRAISESGSALSPSAIQMDPIQVAGQLANAIHCPISDYRSMLECLRQVPAEVLLQASISSMELAGSWRPVIDGEFITGRPIDLLTDGIYNPVDYLIGINKHEGFNQIQYLRGVNLDDMSSDQFEDIINYFVRTYYQFNVEEIRRAAVNEYLNCVLDDLELRQGFVEFLTDFHYAAPANLVAGLMTKKGERNVYVYEFDHRPTTADDDGRPDYVTAVHLDEVDFTLGTLQPASTSSERRLSVALQQAWSNFVKVGNPNPVVAGLPWRPFNVGSGHYVELDTRLSSSSAKTHMRRRRMAFWNSYVNELRLSTPCSKSLDQCERTYRPMRLREEQVSVAVAVLAGVCGLLLLLVIILVVRLRMGRERWIKCWACCCQRKPKTPQEAERKKLHPLPYYDEPIHS